MAVLTGLEPATSAVAYVRASAGPVVYGGVSDPSNTVRASSTMLGTPQLSLAVSHGVPIEQRMVCPMSRRYRLEPTPEQEQVMRVHVGQARFVWNLALEQCDLARRFGRYADQKSWDRQLAEARREIDWLGAGSSSVQQAALRDLRQAFRNWWTNPGHFGPPRRRKHGVAEGFAIRDLTVRKLSRKWAEVTVPKAGRVRFRLSRPLPPDAKSARVTLDRAGRWHVSIVAIPDRIDGPGTGEIVGVDRGVAATVALSTGELLHAPKPDYAKRARLQRRMARQQKGSNRRERTRRRIARLATKEADRRKDWVEKVTTDLACRFDVVVLEDLRVANMVRSAKGTADQPGVNVAAKRGLNRSIHEQSWGRLQTRLGHKIGDRMVLVPAAYTSQRCHKCGHTAAANRAGQARFVCRACGHTGNADVNAAKNIAAGQAVSGRGGTGAIRPPDEASTLELVGVR